MVVRTTESGGGIQHDEPLTLTQHGHGQTPPTSARSAPHVLRQCSRGQASSSTANGNGPVRLAMGIEAPFVSPRVGVGALVSAFS